MAFINKTFIMLEMKSLILTPKYVLWSRGGPQTGWQIRDEAASVRVTVLEKAFQSAYWKGKLKDTDACFFLTNDGPVAEAYFWCQFSFPPSVGSLRPVGGSFTFPRPDCHHPVHHQPVGAADALPGSGLCWWPLGVLLSHRRTSAQFGCEGALETLCVLLSPFS